VAVLSWTWCDLTDAAALTFPTIGHECGGVEELAQAREISILYVHDLLAEGPLYLSSP